MYCCIYTRIRISINGGRNSVVGRLEYSIGLCGVEAGHGLQHDRLMTRSQGGYVNNLVVRGTAHEGHR